MSPESQGSTGARDGFASLLKSRNRTGQTHYHARAHLESDVLRIYAANRGKANDSAENSLGRNPVRYPIVPMRVSGVKETLVQAPA